MTQTEILDLLYRTGAIVDGHCDCGDGLHAERSIRVVKATQFAPFNRKLCYEIVRHYLELDIHVIVAASQAAIPVAVEVGRQLEARAIFIVENANGPALFDGFELHDGERAVVVEALLERDDQTHGASTLIRRANARLIGTGSIVDTRSSRRRFTIKDVSAIQLRHERYDAASCPLCASGVPLVGALGDAS
jgi:orotate phosphoribosyltransferase